MEIPNDFDVKDFTGQKIQIPYDQKELRIESGSHLVKVNKPKVKGPLFDLFKRENTGRLECSFCLKVCRDDNDLMAHISGVHPR